MNLKLHTSVLLLASMSLGSYAQTPTRLSDINSGTGDATPQNFFAYSNNIYFLAKPATDRQEWYGVNTETGTVTQKTSDHSQISGGVIFRPPVRIGTNVFVSSSKNSTSPNLYFSRFDLTTGAELQWNPNNATSPTDPLSFAIDSATTDVYCTFSTTTAGNQIFKWNHTTAGVSQFSTIGSAGVGSNGNISNGGALVVIGNYIYTTSFGGTGNNLNYPIRISLTDGSIFTELLSNGSRLYDATRFNNLNGKLYFVARSGSGSGPVNLYCYDPSTTTVTALTNYTLTLASGNVNITAINPDNTFFVGVSYYNTNPIQGEMLLVNPTNNNVTHLNSSIQTGTAYAYLLTSGTTAYFSQASGSNRILLKYNMTNNTADTVVPAGAGFTAITNFFVATDGKAYFSGTTAANGAELWSYDLSTNATTLISDIYSGTTGSAPASFTQVGSKLFFAAKDATYGRELYSLQLGAPLAIHLATFTAHNNGSVNIIDWKNATEEVGDNMLLQSSIDGKSFRTIATFQASGKPNSEYEYTDEQPVQGINYYRLMITYKNGENTFSNVATAFVTSTNEAVVYPNPVTNVLNINSTKSGMGYVIDASGTYKLTSKLNAGSNKIDISKLASGVYILELHIDGQITNRRFVKQ